jgi:hypothetical protein
MRVLMLDEEAKEKVAQVMSYARKNIFHPGTDTEVPGDNPSHVCYLNTYRCVFTYTKAPISGELYRHLSISVPSKDYPSPEAIIAIADLFEFSEASQGIEARLAAGKWFMHVEKNEPHCIVLAEELTQ